MLSLIQRLEDMISIRCSQYIQAELPVGTQYRHSSCPHIDGCPHRVRVYMTKELQNVPPEKYV